MALKADRQIDAVEIGYFINEVAEKGLIVVPLTAGSGIALDSAMNVATVAASASGNYPLGMLMNDFVSIDVTKQYLNYHKDQSILGSKATIMTKGWAVTNKVTGTPAGNQTAVLTASGYVTTGTVSATTPAVGRFRSKVNADGFVRLYVDL